MSETDARSMALPALCVSLALVASALILRDGMLRVGSVKDAGRVAVGGGEGPGTDSQLSDRGEGEDPASLTLKRMEFLSGSIARYYMRKFILPVTLRDLTVPTSSQEGPILSAVPFDSWGNEFEYCHEGASRFELRSLGPDGTAETSDDILFGR